MPIPEHKPVQAKEPLAAAHCSAREKLLCRSKVKVKIPVELMLEAEKEANRRNRSVWVVAVGDPMHPNTYSLGITDHYETAMVLDRYEVSPNTQPLTMATPERKLPSPLAEAHGRTNSSPMTARQPTPDDTLNVVPPATPGNGEAGQAFGAATLLDPLHVISLGAGVQSSVMALMAAAGEITPMPSYAIFADTHAEPESVYRWLDWLEKQLPYPVLRVSNGNLTEMALRIREKKDGTGLWAKSVIPAYVKNPDGTRGIIQRQCTYDYKVVPLTRTALKLMKQHGKKSVVQWIGISLDEAHRMKPSRDKRIENRWPLIDAGMKRYQCLQWMEKRNLPKPPRSACVYCPYHSDAEWRRLKTEEPEAFAAAVKFDEDYRRVKQETNNMHGLTYLHNSLIPLRDVDFSTDTDNGQQILFGNECEGMCGV